MMTLEQISDRLSLQQLVVDYANAIDERAYDRLDQVFTPDAYIDYRAMGGIDGAYPKVKAWLPQALAAFPAYMHFVGNFSCVIAGDTATGSTACFNPMEVPRPPGADGSGGSDVMFLGLWYIDRFVRTPQGWRISERVERKCYNHNMPEWMRKALQI
ncbi:MAG: nuclear transport factor 2 family protein [Nevskia sp.]|nr:nuclear transport factor 2 family protein [Nevskia sp.]